MTNDDTVQSLPWHLEISRLGGPGWWQRDIRVNTTIAVRDLVGNDQILQPTWMLMLLLPSSHFMRHLHKSNILGSRSSILIKERFSRILCVCWKDSGRLFFVQCTHYGAPVISPVIWYVWICRAFSTHSGAASASEILGMTWENAG
jgi:hypothetical protein